MASTSSGVSPDTLLNYGAAAAEHAGSAPPPPAEAGYFSQGYPGVPAYGSYMQQVCGVWSQACKCAALVSSIW